MPEFRRSGDMRSFTAQYVGVCPNCGDTIYPGDKARYEDDVVIHDDCASAATVRSPRAYQICPECHMVAPCGCDPSDLF